MYEISAREYESRRERVMEELERRELDALILFGPLRIFYITGYHLLATERPVAYTMPLRDEAFFFVPRLEKDHVKHRLPWAKGVVSYFEYPGREHPMEAFGRELRHRELEGKKIGADSMGYPGIWGYKGPKLDEVLKDTKVELVEDLIDLMRIVKSEAEVRLLKESAKWTSLAFSYLQEYTWPGVSEAEASMLASMEASKAMIRALGPGTTFRRLPPVRAGYRGQVGRLSYFPHMLSNNLRIRVGDVLGGGAGADVGGYSAELERTMIVGQPTDRQKKLFDVMLRSQRAALGAFKPGVPCHKPNRAAFRVLKEEGVMELCQHRVGHGIGLEGHEPPWIEDGDETVMEPGMVFSCEPGIYDPQLGGFRHSDTVVITEDGSEVITRYPSELEDLIIK